MAYDGSGNFVRLHNWTQDAANNIDINAGECDAEDSGFAAGLSLAVTRDGQGKMAADFLPNTDNLYNLGSGVRRWASINGSPIASFQTGVQSAAEATAGVTPTNLQFSANPHDIRRYGAVMDGTTDDAIPFGKLALVMAAGGNGYLPPLKMMIKSQVTFGSNTANDARVALFGYGCEIFTTNAIDAIRTNSFTSVGGIDFLGITVSQTDATATGGFVAYGSLNCYFIDCSVLISSTVAAGASYTPFKATQSNPANAATGALWNRFVRCKTRQASGNASFYAPFGVFIDGQSNANTVEGCTFTSVNYSVALYNQLGGVNPHALPNAIRIDGNAFEGGIQAVIVNGQADVTSQVSGLRITNNRAESLTGGFLLFQGLGVDSTSVPTWLSANYLVSSVVAYVSQSNVAGLQVTYNAWEPSLIPAITGGGNTNLTTSGQFQFTNIASSGGLYDAVIGEVQTVGGGLTLQNTVAGGTRLWSSRYRAGGGAAVDAPNGQDLEGIDGISRTNGVRRKTFTGNAAFVTSTTTAVTITTEPDTNYMILVEANPSTGAITVSSKTTGGFTLTAALSNSQSVPFMLVGR
jgi:hypothetical protein